MPGCRPARPGCYVVVPGGRGAGERKELALWNPIHNSVHRRIQCTVVYLEDGTPVNFVYEVTGLGSFARKRRQVTDARIHGHELPVLRLERILKSKTAIGRDKDKLHVVLIRDILRCRRAVGDRDAACEAASAPRNRNRRSVMARLTPLPRSRQPGCCRCLLRGAPYRLW